MALPKINQPLFELTIPSLKKKVKYRPFTVREEKILLIAQQSEDIDQIILSIKQIVSNCLQAKIDVDNLATFDIEYILIKLRASSINNEVTFKIIDGDTGEEVEVEIDLNKIEVNFPENHKDVVPLSDGLMIKMRYPNPGMMPKLLKAQENRVDVLFDTMVACIDSIIEGENVHKLSDYTSKEVEEFIESLTVEHMQGIKQFFDTMPSIKIKIDYTLKDGTKKSQTISGTESLFLS